MSLSLNRPSLLDSVSVIRSGRFDWKLKVRVVRIWEVADRGVADVVDSVEMILVDQLGDRIQATVLKRLVPLFRGSLFEGEVYLMSFFSVLPNVGLLLCTSHAYKLLFDSRTSVRPTIGFSIPTYGLSIASGLEISSLVDEYPYLVDVAGLVVAISTGENIELDGVMTKTVLIDLVDESYKFHCVLYGLYADEFQSLINSASEGLPIVILQFVRVSNYGGVPTLLLVDGVSRILLNPAVAEFVQLKVRLSCDGGSIKDFGWGKNHKRTCSSDRCLVTKYPRKTLFQLRRCVETGVFLVVAKIVKVLERESWWFPVCKCGRVMGVFCGSYYCGRCCLRIFDVVPKLKARVVVDDGTGVADLLLFEDVVSDMVMKFSLRAVDGSKRVRVDRNPYLLLPSKDDDVAFKVRVSSQQRGSGCPIYSGKRLFISGVSMDEIISQGFNYTPAKCLFRPMFSPWSPRELGEVSTLDVDDDCLSVEDGDVEPLRCSFAPLLNSGILVGRRRLFFG